MARSNLTHARSEDRTGIAFTINGDAIPDEADLAPSPTAFLSMSMNDGGFGHRAQLQAIWRTGALSFAAVDSFMKSSLAMAFGDCGSVLMLRRPVTRLFKIEEFAACIPSDAMLVVGNNVEFLPAPDVPADWLAYSPVGLRVDVGTPECTQVCRITACDSCLPRHPATTTEQLALLLHAPGGDHLRFICPHLGCESIGAAGLGRAGLSHVCI